MTRSLQLLALAIIVTLLLTACGNQQPTESEATQPPPTVGDAATDTAASATAAAPIDTALAATEVTAPTESPAPFAAQATVGDSQNDVTARTSESDTLAPAQVGFQLNVGGQVKTGVDSKARLDFVDGSILRMGESSFFTITEVSQTSEGLLTRIQVEIGKFWISLTGGSLEIETPVGSASVRGSWAVFEYDPGDPNDPNDDVLTFNCLEGECKLVVDGETIVLSNFGQIVLRNGRQQRELGCLDEEVVIDFRSNNPESNALAPTLTAVAQNRCTETPTPEATATRPPTRLPSTATSAPPTDTPAPQCQPGEYFDPFLNRCRRPEDNTPYSGLNLNDSPLYGALASDVLARTRNSIPVGLMSLSLAAVGLVVIGWGYRHNRK